ncbi:MAG: hypothetical protein WBD31_13075 [Rubripirellula sp.]
MSSHAERLFDGEEEGGSEEIEEGNREEEEPASGESRAGFFEPAVERRRWMYGSLRQFLLSRLQQSWFRFDVGGRLARREKT